MYSRGWETRKVRVLGSAALAAGLLLLATACDGGPAAPRVSTDGPFPAVLEWVSPPGSLAAPGAFPQARIEVPTEIRAGEPFTARIVTVVASLCWEDAGTQTVMEGAVARVTARDRLPDTLQLCAQALGELPREVSLTFDHAGTATIRLVGRRIRGDDVDLDEPMTLERTVEVLP